MTFLLGPRIWLANRTFRKGYPFLLKDSACTDALFDAVAPQPGERILLTRNAYSPSVLPFVRSHPGAHFVSLEPDEASYLAAEREISSMKAANVVTIRAGDPSLLPLEDESFDKVASIMNLHTAGLAPRLAMVREMRRVLRRKGLIYAADIDAPATQAERNFLKITHFALGDEQVQPHSDGTWPDILTAAGFSRVKRLASQSSLSVRIGVVRAQRR
ncbi:class I SAM-dependent methyltransferase [Methylobacterium iners]|uniref:Methyltransferase type 11 domain-containing protein n=1 Tax=Methylobacterium iners TaxID=418707 RepID=A0ABQ4RW67_9HYPH|nr:class I SAM-dependent methyltransferase [Methylobacterium iners]GJD94489.1 hypothetical protein OCOJLMKI_1691 [Methylobacterium iners]